LDSILATVMERVEQRLDRELASTRDVVSESIEAHVQHAGELAEDRAVWLAAEVRRLSTVIDAAPWTTNQEALNQDLDALQEEVRTVLRHSESLKHHQETLQQEVASCVHSSREALMGCNNCTLQSFASKLEAIEATEQQHQTEVTMALQSLSQRVAELAAPTEGQWDDHQPKVASSNQQHLEQHVGATTADARAGGTEIEEHRNTQRGSTPVKPGKVLMLEEANGNTPARAVVSLAVMEVEAISSPARLCGDWPAGVSAAEAAGGSPVGLRQLGDISKVECNANGKEGCGNLPLTPTHHSSWDAILQRSGSG